MHATETTAVEVERPAHHAHAVMHCNLNTIDARSGTAFYMAAFGVEPRMRSVERSGDATALGLFQGISSATTFLYDRRGPRSAPALELVEWHHPRTTPAWPGTADPAFTSIGYRVPALRHLRSRLTALGQPFDEVPGGLRVRGDSRPALRTVDPDGVVVEAVEIATVPDDPQHDGLLSHERMVASDLDHTVAWYGTIGWSLRSSGTDDGVRWASLTLPEDPTFSLEFTQAAPAAGAPRTAITQGLYRMALAVDDVQEAAASLRAEGGCGEVPEPSVIPMPDTPTGGFTVLFLRAPDGAVVELVERPRSQVRRPLRPA